MNDDFFDLSVKPFEQFQRLLKEAETAKVCEPTAMTVATVDDQGEPSLRIVYLKGTINEGFVFYTNYNGQKSKEILSHPNICLNFYWAEQVRQVRIKGHATKTSREQSEAYFKTRPRLSQIGAWASNQSEVLESVEVFNQRFNEYEKKFEGGDVPCPPHWGGFVIEPSYYEFWFGRMGRLHDRFIYEKAGASWKTFRRNP